MTGQVAEWPVICLDLGLLFFYLVQESLIKSSKFYSSENSYIGSALYNDNVDLNYCQILMVLLSTFGIMHGYHC